MFDGHVETSMAQHEQIVRCIAERNEAALRAIFVEHSAHVLAAVHRFVEMDRRASAEGVGEVAAAAATPKRTARIAS
jgi:DNA-binding GntR family transcriptional regulator